MSFAKLQKRAPDKPTPAHPASARAVPFRLGRLQAAERAHDAGFRATQAERLDNPASRLERAERLGHHISRVAVSRPAGLAGGLEGGSRGFARSLGSAAGFVQRGVGKSKLQESYFRINADEANYQFTVAADSPAGGLIEVTTELDEERIGYVSFSFENVDQVAPPNEDELFTKAHVLGREAGKICHLAQIMNLSLTRDGPANIFSGFANQLMEMVELKAKERGARLIYLEPAASMVRQDPNNNKKASVDPTAFYVNKHGYSFDVDATLHNGAIFDELSKNSELPEETLLAKKASFNLAQLSGTLTKAL